MKQYGLRGFTLIEVLVALVVFGILTILTYSTMGQTFSNADYISGRMDRLQKIQRTIRYLTNDLSSAAPRPVRSEIGDSYMPSMMVSSANNFALAVTHGGWSNPAGLPRSTLQRSVYLLQENKLFRIYYNVLDTTFSNNGISTEILDDVLSLEINLYDDDGQITNEWPPLNIEGSMNLSVRPRAAEIILTLDGEGEIRRIIEITS